MSDKDDLRAMSQPIAQGSDPLAGDGGTDWRFGKRLKAKQKAKPESDTRRIARNLLAAVDDGESLEGIIAALSTGDPQHLGVRAQALIRESEERAQNDKI